MTVRDSLIEAELPVIGRNRVQVNKQKLQRVRDLLGTVRVTVFSPDDLTIVKGGPGDDVGSWTTPLLLLRSSMTWHALISTESSDSGTHSSSRHRKPDYRDLPTELSATLDVWDSKFAEIADQFGYARATLVSRITPMVRDAYEQLAGVATPIELKYEPEWRRVGLIAALQAVRTDDVRRGVSTVGPHRDELELSINGLASRTHASQGEQRTLALALRLAGHRLVTERTESAPILVLDDVLSELDDGRARALLGHLPGGQVVITSASKLPSAAKADRIIRIKNGTVVSGSR